jgi:hypothetical protein
LTLSGTPDLAFIAAPWQVIVLLFLAVGLLAPQLLPKIGRSLGRLLRAEMLRRLGLPGGSPVRRPTAQPAADRPRTPAPTEILMPERPEPTLRSRADRSIVPASTAPPASAKSANLWLAGMGVLAAAGAIFWLLLHSR